MSVNNVIEDVRTSKDIINVCHNLLLSCYDLISEVVDTIGKCCGQFITRKVVGGTVLPSLQS